MIHYILFILQIFAIAVGNTSAQDEDSFVKNYDKLEEWLFDVEGELYSVENFVYLKDVATFHFEKGTILLRRPVLGRPTVGVFLGKGSVEINVPSHSEKQTLLAVTKDSSVNQAIDFIYFRFADDFDLVLKKEFDWNQGALTAQQARKAKAEKGDNYFKPIKSQTTDNYFQLLKSAYNRKSDGYFWASFGKYVYTFDPAINEEVRIYYARAMTDFFPILVSKFQRKENFPQEESKMSEISFSARCIGQNSELDLGGSDGYQIISANSKITFLTEKDSAKFLSLFIDENLIVDSVFCGDTKIQFHKRRDLYHLGVILPEWKHVGDSTSVSVWYHGTEYISPFPQLFSQTSFPHDLSISAPSNYNYIFPCNETVITKLGDKIKYVTSGKDEASYPMFLPILTGFRTILTETSWGMPVHFVMPSVGYFGPLEREKYRDTILLALEYMYSSFGKPEKVNELYVLSGTGPSTYPGVSVFSDYNLGQTEYGGFCHVAGRVMARQWINVESGELSYRENWIRDAFREYLSLLFVQAKLGNKAFYTNLDYTRKTVLNTVEKEEDLPLSTGISGFYSTVKGTWLIHMLRNLFNKDDTRLDRKLFAFLNEIIDSLYLNQMSNEQFTEISESYFGYEMDWFFNKYLYSAGVPEYEVSHFIERRGDAYFVKLKVVTKGVEESFLMPILIRIDFSKEPTYHNQYIAAKIQNYEFGPFSEPPSQIHFNKFYSVLSNTKIAAAK